MNYLKINLFRIRRTWIEFDEVIECVKNTIKRDMETKENKANTKLESHLLDFIEIAKNLLDVLDDETISRLI